MARPEGGGGVEELVQLNVGGRRFSTSRQTLTWAPDSFFSSLLSGRISTLKDETGAIFIDRDPDIFAPILNFLRTKELDLRGTNVSVLLHEAEFYGIAPLVHRLKLCNELEQSSCGSVLFSGYLPPPVFPAKQWNRHSVAGPQLLEQTLVRRSNTMPPNPGSSGLLGRLPEERETSANVDECQNVSLCGTHANCHNLPGSFQCICDQGYESARDGQHCLDVNECETLRGVCGTAPCENVEGSFLCICPGAAEEFDPTTRRCLRPPGAPAARPPAFPRRPEAPLSEPHPSGASDGSRRECYYDPNAAQACENVLAWNATRQECCCSLGHGWGLDCHVQECPPFGSAEFQTLCPHGSGFAAAAAGPGFAASAVADVDECSLFSSQVCKGGVCVNQVPSYSCYCPSGYYYETQHLECIDNDECQDEEAEPCLGGHCINTIGSYYCSCAPPLVLDTSQHRCVANDSRDANLAMCWQEVGPDLVCSRPRLDRQVTYTECCCLYGEAWSMDCALCPARDSEDFEALCNILRPPSYGPGRPPGLGLPFEYGGREFVPYGPEIFAPPVRPVPRLPDYDPYLRDSLYGPSPYEASDFEDPSYGDLLQDGRYPARGPPEPEWLYPLGGSSSSSRSGGSFSERPGRASEDYRHSEEFGAPHAEECGILSGCDNGRCVRVADGFTCLCHEGYRLDPTRMACLDIDECIEVEGLCLGGECFNMDGFYRCLCPRGMVPTGQPPRCVISAPHSQG